PLEPLAVHLQAQGWEVQPQADWTATLGLLDEDVPARRQPVLPATLGTEAESLLLRRPAGDDRLQVVRLWRAPALLADGTPLWIGVVQSLEYQRPLSGLFGIWLPAMDDDGAYSALRDSLDGLAVREAPHPQGDAPVLRVRTVASGSGQQP